jgi:hypothetical protein
MKNITLITSIIDTPNTPLSYIKTRSVFSKEQRFEQTKKTILSIREKIPNNKILLVECSILTSEERDFFIENVDYFLNVYDTNDNDLINRMFTISKSMGEGTMTIIALQYIFNNNINFDYLYKISGRYWLNDNFNYNLFDNNLSCIHNIYNNTNNVFTCFYKLTNKMTYDWFQFLLNSEDDFINCVGYEVIFAKFLINYNNNIIIENKIGINGYVTVCGTYIDM